MKKVELYLSGDCTPCQEVKEELKAQFTDQEVEIVDIDTDEGFQRFYDNILSKEDGELPSAYRDGKKCLIGRTEEGILAIECPTDAPPTPSP